MNTLHLYFLTFLDSWINMIQHPGWMVAWFFVQVTCCPPKSCINRLPLKLTTMQQGLAPHNLSVLNVEKIFFLTWGWCIYTLYFINENKIRSSVWKKQISQHFKVLKSEVNFLPISNGRVPSNTVTTSPNSQVEVDDEIYGFGGVFWVV